MSWLNFSHHIVPYKYLIIKRLEEKILYSTSNIWKSKNYWLQCTTFKEISKARSTTSDERKIVQTYKIIITLDSVLSWFSKDKVSKIIANVFTVNSCVAMTSLRIYIFRFLGLYIISRVFTTNPQKNWVSLGYSLWTLMYQVKPCIYAHKSKSKWK